MIEQKDLDTNSLNEGIKYILMNEKDMINNLKNEPKLNASTIIVNKILNK